MCRLLVVFVLFMVIDVYSKEIPTVQEIKAQLTSAGISGSAADGIIAIGEEHQTEFAAAKNDREESKKIFENVKTEVEEYIKTQSEADQTAYAAYVEKKKTEFEEMKKSANGA